MTLDYAIEEFPKCKSCKGKFCVKCHKYSEVAMITLDQICTECAKAAKMSAVYQCNRCKGLFEVSADEDLPRTKPGYVLCGFCVLQDQGEI